MFFENILLIKLKLANWISELFFTTVFKI